MSVCPKCGAKQYWRRGQHHFYDCGSRNIPEYGDRYFLDSAGCVKNRLEPKIANLESQLAALASPDVVTVSVEDLREVMGCISLSPEHIGLYERLKAAYDKAKTEGR